MRPDAPPHDVNIALPDRRTVLEGSSSIVCPGHLEDAGGPFYAFDSEAFAEAPSPLKVFHKLRDGSQEGCLLVR